MMRKKPSPEQGSALLVTIMITSVVLLLAMILLERIIPYSRQIRGMQDSLQAYYTAKGEIELAKNDFHKKALRENIDSVPGRIIPGAGRTIGISMPHVSKKKAVLTAADITENEMGDYVIVSNHNELPLQIRLFDNDTIPRGFGTSQKDPNFHSLASYGGGLLFDLTKKDTSSPPFFMKAHTDSSNASTSGGIRVEFVYTDGSGSTPFFGTVGTAGTPGPLEGKNIATALDKNREAGRDTLTYRMNLQNCYFGSCALKLHLTDTTIPSLPVAFSLSTAIPDLNAVVIADGLSEKGTYHARIIELIPLVQSI
jgi:hypothetical protein